jgi:hypothetical protein
MCEVKWNRERNTMNGRMRYPIISEAFYRQMAGRTNTTPRPRAPNSCTQLFSRVQRLAGLARGDTRLGRRNHAAGGGESKKVLGLSIACHLFGNGARGPWGEPESLSCSVNASG